MSDTPTVTQQYAFTVGEEGDTDAGIEPAEESVETDLEAFGADIDHREQDSRLDQPEASSFGVDDRPEVTSIDGSEQGTLFADTDDDQQTLTGERAASKCLFETDESDDSPTEPVPDDPTDAGEDTHEAPARAIADGGHPEDDTDDTRAARDTTDGDGEDGNDQDAAPDESDDEIVTDSERDTTFDPDEETVTDAWEGVFISASWGYNQTNVELAQITDVSESGKTVLARRVGAERVDHSRTSEQLRPTAEQYGDEFRLHVRDGIDGDPRFRGSYPLGNDGDMDGPTRRESFYPFDNEAENSIRQTAPNRGH